MPAFATSTLVRTHARHDRRLCPHWSHLHALRVWPKPDRVSVQMVDSGVAPSVENWAGLDVAGRESVVDAYEAFVSFFNSQSGSWNSSRTYHYVPQNEREDSSTTFDVARLNREQVLDVLSANGDAEMYDEQMQSKAQGFQVSFLTKMASQEELVRSATELAFLPTAIRGGVVSGAYYRKVGYEEKGAVRARFNFEASKNRLNMITYYTRVVSVDEITLVNATTRVRKIINFARPPDGGELCDVALVGFGVEKKRSGSDPRVVF